MASDDKITRLEREVADLKKETNDLRKRMKKMEEADAGRKKREKQFNDRLSQFMRQARHLTDLKF